jgi:hypothetical protein
MGMSSDFRLPPVVFSPAVSISATDVVFDTALVSGGFVFVFSGAAVAATDGGNRNELAGAPVSINDCPPFVRNGFEGGVGVGTGGGFLVSLGGRGVCLVSIVSVCFVACGNVTGGG